jgi:hypothetical protein
MPEDDGSTDKWHIKNRRLSHQLKTQVKEKRIPPWLHSHMLHSWLPGLVFRPVLYWRHLHFLFSRVVRCCMFGCVRVVGSQGTGRWDTSRSTSPSRGLVSGWVVFEKKEFSFRGSVWKHRLGVCLCVSKCGFVLVKDWENRCIELVCSGVLVAE